MDQGTGARKAAAALDSFANVTAGFSFLLAGDCFEDVIVTAINISQADTPLNRRVPNLGISFSFLEVMERAEMVPSAIGLITGGSDTYTWIVTFAVTTILAAAVAACLGVQCFRGSGEGSTHVDEDESRVTNVDGSLLDTPRSSDYGKDNRMFSPRASHERRGRSGSRKSAAQKRAALNARSIPNFGNNTKASQGDFEIADEADVSTAEVGCLLSSVSGGDDEISTRNPMFGGGHHVPRLSALDFDDTSGSEENSDTAGGTDFR